MHERKSPTQSATLYKIGTKKKAMIIYGLLLKIRMV